MIERIAWFFLPLVIKTLFYYLIFRQQGRRVGATNYILLGGSSAIPVAIVGMPYLVGRLTSIAVAVYILHRYIEVKIFPKGLLIVLGVEITYSLVSEYILIPLLL